MASGSTPEAAAQLLADELPEVEVDDARHVSILVLAHLLAQRQLVVPAITTEAIGRIDMELADVASIGDETTVSGRDEALIHLRSQLTHQPPGHVTLTDAD